MVNVLNMDNTFSIIAVLSYKLKRFYIQESNIFEDILH